MELALTCRYCGHKWEKTVYANVHIDDKCPKCDDRNIDVKELSKSKIDTYAGAPEFVKKDKKEDYYGF